MHPREAVSVDHHTAFAGVRAVDSKLSRRARTEAFDVLGLCFGIVRIAARPLPRVDFLERLLGAHEPSFFHPAGMAHKAARK